MPTVMYANMISVIVWVFLLCVQGSDGAYCNEYSYGSSTPRVYYCSYRCCGSLYDDKCCDSSGNEYDSSGNEYDGDGGQVNGVWIAGAVVGGIVSMIIIIIVIVVIVKACTKSGQRGRVIHPNQNPAIFVRTNATGGRGGTVGQPPKPPNYTAAPPAYSQPVYPMPGSSHPAYPPGPPPMYHPPPGPGSGPADPVHATGEPQPTPAPGPLGPPQPQPDLSPPPYDPGPNDSTQLQPGPPSSTQGSSPGLLGDPAHPPSVPPVPPAKTGAGTAPT